MNIYAFLKKTGHRIISRRKFSLILISGKLSNAATVLFHTVSHHIRHVSMIAVRPAFTLVFMGIVLNAGIAAASEFQHLNPCPFPAAQGLPEGRIVCGTLTVPENRNKPHLGSLKLPVAIIKTASSNPLPDPVVFLSGGPGASVTNSPRTFELFAGHSFGEQRDIILMTQRGGYMSEPALMCDALAEARKTIYLADHTLAERDTAITEIAKACLLNLQSEGRDLSSYSAAANAHDFKDLRAALGIKAWNLLGVSYGTYIALEIARHDTDGIRSMLLDSLVSMESDLFMSETAMNFSSAVNEILSACEADQACNERFPGLMRRLQKALKQLHEAPRIITLDGPDGPLDMYVNWHDFLGLMHWMLYSVKTIPLVPLLIEEVADGKTTLMTTLMNRVFPAPKNNDPSAAGAFFAVVCQDQYTRRNPIQPTNTGDFGGFAITSFMETLCSDPALSYGKQQAPVPVQSDIPTLLFSGRFDPITPQRYAEDVQQSLTNSSLIRIPHYGHSTLSGYTECQTQLAAAFLSDLEPKEKYPCLSTLPPVSFILSASDAYKALGITEGE